MAEFKAIVDALHAAGLEVLLDVVFNHTAEGNHLGPTLCHRGIDNPAYYRLDPDDLRLYIDTTGTGNSLNEPWEVGQGDSYDLGRFPPLWREWNGKYRDSMRDFWRSVPLLLGGDEMGRTPLGNNNAYCQDNATTWFDWSQVDGELLTFTRRLLRFRKCHPVLRRQRFLAGVEASEIGWFTPDGQPMTGADWADADARCLTIYLDGCDAAPANVALHAADTRTVGPRSLLVLVGSTR